MHITRQLNALPPRRLVIDGELVVLDGDGIKFCEAHVRAEGRPVGLGLVSGVRRAAATATPEADRNPVTSFLSVLTDSRLPG
jgi:hypothetical protein